MSNLKYILGSVFGGGAAIIAFIAYLGNIRTGEVSVYYQPPNYTKKVAKTFQSKSYGATEVTSFELVSRLQREKVKEFTKFFTNNINNFNVEEFKKSMYDICREIAIDKFIMQEALKSPKNEQEIKKQAIFMTLLTSFSVNKPFDVTRYKKMLTDKSTTEETEDKFVLWKFQTNNSEEMGNILFISRASTRFPAIESLLSVASRYCQPVKYASKSEGNLDTGYSKNELSQFLTADEIKLVEKTENKSCSKVIKKNKKDNKKEYVMFYVVKTQAPKDIGSIFSMASPDQIVIQQSKEQYVKEGKIKVVYTPKTVKDLADNAEKTALIIQDDAIIDNIPHIVKSKEIESIAKFVFNTQELDDLMVQRGFEILVWIYTCAIIAKETKWDKTKAFADNVKYNMIQAGCAKFLDNIRKSNLSVKESVKSFYQFQYLSTDSDRISLYVGKIIDDNQNNPNLQQIFTSLIEDYGLNPNKIQEQNLEEIQKNFGQELMSMDGQPTQISDDKKVYVCFDPQKRITTFIHILKHDSKKITESIADDAYAEYRKNLDKYII